jgi:hypothetical protein
MVTVKERALALTREDQESSSRAQSECERDEQELAELEILFAEARLQRPPQGAEKNVGDVDGWTKVHRTVKRCEGGPNKSFWIFFKLLIVEVSVSHNFFKRASVWGVIIRSL